jgi:DNA helicase II / ATP-dependent DNA helicase PcrA
MSEKQISLFHHETAETPDPTTSSASNDAGAPGPACRSDQSADRSGNEAERSWPDGNDAAHPPTQWLTLPEQEAAITHAGGPLLIVAGAGSGKTTVMARRIVHFVQNENLRADQILGLTFSNKAAANLRQRASGELGPGNDVGVHTYHGFGAQILNEHYATLGFTEPPRLLDKARSWQLLYGALDDVTIAHRKTGRLSSLISSAMQLASACSDHLISVEEVEANCRELLQGRTHKKIEATLLARLDLCAMASAYLTAKKRYNCIDFNDQISLPVQLLLNHPSLRAELHQRHRAILLDEYQDTNFAQRRMIELIAMPDPAKPSELANLTAVGDDMQSIYAFRGAHIANILAFEHHLPNTTVLKLETNHRSGPDIVTLANFVQSHVPNARPKTLQARLDAPTASIERFLSADDRDEARTIAKRCLEIGAPWNEIAILCRKRRIISAIAEELTDLGIPVDVAGLGGLLVRPEITDVVAWCEIATAFGPEDQQLFDAFATPSETSHEQRRIAQSWNGPDPSIALLRVLQGPGYRIGMRDLAALARHARQARQRYREQRDKLTDDTTQGRDTQIDLVSTLEDTDTIADLSPDAWVRLKGFLEQRKTIRAYLRTGPNIAAFLEFVVDRIGLWNVADDRTHENLLRFLDLAEHFTKLVPDRFDALWNVPESPEGDQREALPHGRTGMLEFLEYLELMREAQDDQAEAIATGEDAIRIMTIHQSKGLEFDTVFLPGLTGDKKSNIFPDERKPQNGATQPDVLPKWLRADTTRDPHGRPIVPPMRTNADLDILSVEARNALMQEELRLLYVAVTRARRTLICSAAHWYPGPKKPQGESIFYDLIGESGVAPELHRAPATQDDPDVVARQRRLAVAINERQARMKPSATNPEAVNEPRTANTALIGKRRSKNTGGSAGQGMLLDPGVGRSTATKTSVLGPFGPLPATGIGIAAQCARRFYWSFLRPLPRRGSLAAQIGTGVHRWIEEHSRGQGSLLPIDLPGDWTDDSTSNSTSDLPIDSPSDSLNDLSFDVTAAPYDREATSKQNFLASRFAGMLPSRSEAPFITTVLTARGTQIIRGRMDATYTIQENGKDITEIVDFKTGHAPERSDVATEIQLALYGLVAIDRFGLSPDGIRTTVCYLGGDQPVERTQQWSSEIAEAMRARVCALLDELHQGRFGVNPSSSCRNCDFAAFCEGAQAFRSTPVSSPK